MNLLKALAKVSSITLLSRLLGFVRDTLIATLFGASMATDAFFVAFKLPNLLRRLFAEGAFAQAFVPMLGEYRLQRSHQETRAFVAGLAGLLGMLLLIATALCMLAAPLLVWLMAPGFWHQPATFALTVQLLRITLPYILLITLSSLAGSILNSWGRFAVPAFTPALLNLTFILFALFLAPAFHPPVAALAWATFVGGGIQLAYPLWQLKKLDLLPCPRINWHDSAAWRVLRQMGPAVFGVSVAQISLLLNSTFASFLPEGSVSWMYYADRLMEFPTGVLGAALGTILLPSLSRHAVSHQSQRYSGLLDWGIRLSLLLSLPATLGLGLLAGELTRALFMHGQFSAHDAAMTQQALMAYAVGLSGLILIKVLAPGFYARQNIATPVRIALLTLLCTLGLNLLLVFPLHHAGLALSIGLGACLNAALLLRGLIKSRIYTPLPGWGRFMRQLLLALGLMALVLETAPLLLQQLESQRILHLLATITLGASAYFAALFAQGLRTRDFLLRDL